LTAAYQEEYIMSLTRYEPWTQLNQVQKELDRLFDSRRILSRDEEHSPVATCDWVPAVDIKEEQDRFVIHADVPGVNIKDIEITMEKGMLTIKGERQSETKEDRQGYKRIERTHGTFYRRFSLPDTVDPDKIIAKGRNGVLEIVIPKHERTQPRKITVNA
jgi:HSP20 family protein